MIVLDMIESKLYEPEKPMLKKKPPKFQMKIPFESKALDYINFSKVLNNTSAKLCQPAMVSGEDLPRIIYTLSKPLRNKIFNYNQFVSDLDLGSFCPIEALFHVSVVSIRNILTLTESMFLLVI